MTDLSKVRAAAKNLAAARRREQDAETKLRDAIQGALAEGHGATAIAAATGLSRARIYQIRDGRRA